MGCEDGELVVVEVSGGLGDCTGGLVDKCPVVLVGEGGLEEETRGEGRLGR